MYGLPSTDALITDRSGAGNASMTRNNNHPGPMSQSCGSEGFFQLGLGLLKADSAAPASAGMLCSVWH